MSHRMTPHHHGVYTITGGVSQVYGVHKRGTILPVDASTAMDVSLGAFIQQSGAGGVY